MVGEDGANRPLQGGSRLHIRALRGDLSGTGLSGVAFVLENKKRSGRSLGELQLLHFQGLLLKLPGLLRRLIGIARPAHRDQVNQALVKAGLSLPSIDTTAPAATQLSPERREELAQLFSVGGPVSELISEDREGR